MTTADIIELRQGDMTATIAPALGGSVLRLRLGDRDVLRPAPDGADDVLAAASFPLVPFANRIADGKLDDLGRIVQLPADPAAPPHAHHGHGWRAAWSVEEAAENSATLVHEHTADAWPWPYRATQRFSLTPDGLTITLSVLNRDQSQPMPVGVGIHPYFPRASDSRMNAAAASWWVNDDDGVAREPAASDLFAADRPVGVGELEGTDNFFVALDPQVTIDGNGLRTQLAGDGAGFHVYVPAGEDFFCVEPVTHAPNSFGRGEYNPGDRLDPCEERSWTFRITATAA